MESSSPVLSLGEEIFPIYPGNLCLLLLENGRGGGGGGGVGP